MENRDSLERLAANPHYKMSARQLQALRKLQQQEQPVRHATDFQQHDTSFQRHDTDIPQQDTPDATG